MSARGRWTAFLDQIAGRHRLVCDEAAEAARAELPAAGYDPSFIGTVWGAIQTRLVDLESRIIDTWNDKVEATYESEGIAREVQLADRARGADLAWHLENARETLQHSVFADVSRQMYARALAVQQERLCPRCGAPLDVPFTYRALNLTCAHCHAVATFEPGMLVRNVVAFGSHALAWESAREEWLAMRAAERAAKEARSPVPLSLLKAHELAQIAYWWRYFATKSTMEPELHDVAHEVRSRLDAWYRFHAEHEEAWRAAGRPRAAL